MNTSFTRKLGLKKDNSGTWTGIKTLTSKGEMIESFSPVNGKLIGRVNTTDKKAYEKVINKAQSAFEHWRNLPAPQRGEIVRQFGVSC